MRRTKKGGKGAFKKPVCADIDTGETGRPCVYGVIIYTGTGCQRVQVHGPPKSGHGQRRSLQMFGSSAALTHLIQQTRPEEQ